MSIGRLSRITPAQLFFFLATTEFAFLAVSIRCGLVRLTLPPDRLHAAELVAAMLVLPVFAALGFTASPRIARLTILFCCGLALAGLDIALLTFIAPSPV